MANLSLRPPKGPNLPIAPPQYVQQYGDQLNKVLRLYFNEIDNFAVGLLSGAGGATIRFPNGAFHQDGVTTLSANISNNSTTPIQVASTAEFPSAGTILIESELIRYTGKTTTTFTGITRGVYGTTNVAHTAGVYISEAQAVASSTTALALRMTATDTSNEVSIDPLDNSKIVFDVAGYYNIQFSVQLLNFTNQIDNCTFWLRKNTVDIPNSAGVVSVPASHAGGAGAAIVSWNVVIDVNATQNIQLMMASNSGNTVAATYPPGIAPVRPVSPAVILTATFVSALY